MSISEGPLPEREKICRVGDSTLRGFIEREFFAPDYIEGYYVRELLRDSKGDWVVCLERSLLPKHD